MIEEILELIEIAIKATSTQINGSGNDMFWEGKVSGLTFVRDSINRRLTNASSGFAPAQLPDNSNAEVGANR